MTLTTAILSGAKRCGAQAKSKDPENLCATMLLQGNFYQDDFELKVEFLGRALTSEPVEKHCFRMGDVSGHEFIRAKQASACVNGFENELLPLCRKASAQAGVPDTPGFGVVGWRFRCLE